MKPKQRAKIYRKAAELMYSEVGNAATHFHCCCPSLAEVSGWGTKNDKWVNRINFPELFLFKPKIQEGFCDDQWWENGHIEPRIFALLLAAEIAKDSKE